MIDDEAPKESTAKIKALLSQNVAKKVMDFVRDVRSGENMSFERFYDMVRMMGPSQAGWIRLLRKLEAQDGQIIQSSESEFKAQLHLCPWEHTIIATRFLETLFSELNTKLEEGSDVFSILGYIRGMPEHEPESPESSLAGLFEAKSKRRKKREDT